MSFNFWLHGVLVAVHGLSNCCEQGLHAVVVHGALFWWPLSLWNTGLVAPRHVRSSKTRDQTPVLCIGRRILIHYATREVQKDNTFAECLNLDLKRIMMNTMLFSCLGCWISFDFSISLGVILEIELFIFSTNFLYPPPSFISRRKDDKKWSFVS